MDWTRPLLMIVMACMLGTFAGLWDLTAQALTGTVAILVGSAFTLTLLTPRLAAVTLAGLALGVLLANLAAVPPPGTHLPSLDRGLIAAAVALLPSAIGALGGWLIGGLVDRKGWCPPS